MLINSLFYLIFILGSIIWVPQVIFFERRFLGVLQISIGLFIYFLNSFFVFISDAINLLTKFSFSIFSYNFIGIQLSLIFFLFLSISLLFFCGFYYFYWIILFFFFYFFIVVLFTFIPFCFWIFIHFSNSIFSYIGNLSAVLLTVSFELCLWFSFLFVILVYCVLYIFILLCYLIFFFCCLSDWSSTPFDFIEGESELVWGFNTEIGLISFLLLFFWEYIMLFFFMCLSFTLTSLNFFFICILFIYSRALLVSAFFSWICVLFWVFYLFILTFFFFLFFNIFF